MTTPSPGAIGVGSWIGMAASRTRVPFALPMSSIEMRGTPSLASTWRRACSREATGSSIQMEHFEERPIVTTPDVGRACDENSPADMTSRLRALPLLPPPLSVTVVSVITARSLDGNSLGGH
jgi:hypothetical protein